jgi:starch synthase
VLTHRRDVLSGILNGVDYGEWNPATDQHLGRRYTPDDALAGKAACKAALQAELGLAVRPEVPLVAIISRLVDQKGLDLVAPVLREWVQQRDVQWAILGTGDPTYHDLLKDQSKRYPQRVAVRLEFSNPLAHRIEAGADIFLMPSRYEPCGLNQMYSLKYGTIPVVRLTGGLADTIVNLTDEKLSLGSANGFGFRDYGPLALAETLARACHTYTRQPEVWRKLMDNGMRQDWSWRRSAEQYVALYRQTLAQVRPGLAAQEPERG